MTFKEPIEKYAFSQRVIVPAGSQLIFIAGQGPGKAGAPYAQDFHEQVRQCFRHVGDQLAKEGLGFDRVAKITILVVDFDGERHAILTEELKRNFSPAHYPASTLIPVPRLASGECGSRLRPLPWGWGDPGSRVRARMVRKIEEGLALYHAK